MLKLVVVDVRAESRNRIVHELNEYLSSELSEQTLLPRITIKPLSPQELKFHSAPDLCIIGEELVVREIQQVSQIRKLLPEIPLVARLEAQAENLTLIEQLAGLGVDDTFSEQMGPREFFKRIILLARKRKREGSGQVILVDSAKGGLGVTSLVAALGEALLQSGKKVALLDFDSDSQDLSRFLRARPYVNEMLQLLLEQSRPVTEEFVSQCLVRVWDDEPNLLCMPPAPESDELLSNQTTHARTLISVLEILDDTFDVVIVDSGGARGALLRTLYRVADKVISVISSDPSSLYACAERVGRLRGLMSAQARLICVENGISRSGLSSEILKREFVAASKLDEHEWWNGQIPYCEQALRWPGSGSTLFSAGKKRLSVSLQNLLSSLGLIEEQAATLDSLGASTVFSQLATATLNVLRRSRAQLPKAEPRKALLLPTQQISQLEFKSGLQSSKSKADSTSPVAMLGHSSIAPKLALNIATQTENTLVSTPKIESAVPSEQSNQEQFNQGEQVLFRKASVS
jgi:MinD-like ATPase involved in chromosome partitioning or flagellar assembly